MFWTEKFESKREAAEKSPETFEVVKGKLEENARVGD